MSDFLIYQVYLGKKNKLYDFCTQSAKNYAAKYGIGYICQEKPILKIIPKNSNRSKESVSRLGYLPIFEKENAFDLLKTYSKVVIVDADIYIKENSPNIFNFFKTEFAGVIERDLPITQKHKQKLFSYSKAQYSTLKNVDWKWNSSGAEFYNMGLMLLDNNILKYLNGKTAKEFIEQDEFQDFIDGKGNWKWSTDQTLLNYWIKKEKIVTENLSWKWNCLYSAVDNKYLKDAYFIHFFLRDLLPERGENIQKLKQDLGLQ